MCPAVGVSLQELAIGAASRSTVARFLIDARRRDGVMTQCVGRLGLKQLPMPVDVPTSRLLALSYRLVDGSQTIQACRSAAQGFDRLNPNGYFKFNEADSIARSGTGDTASAAGRRLRGGPGLATRPWQKLEVFFDEIGPKR